MKRPGFEAHHPNFNEQSYNSTFTWDLTVRTETLSPLPLPVSCLQTYFLFSIFFYITFLYLSYEIYRVIRKSLRGFRPLRYSSRDGHAEGEHINRGRDTPSFCPTLQVHVYGRNLITRLTSAASPRVETSSTCKVGQKFGVSLPLLTCSPSA